MFREMRRNRAATRAIRRMLRRVNGPTVLWGGHPDRTVAFGSTLDRVRSMARRDGLAAAVNAYRDELGS